MYLTLHGNGYIIQSARRALFASKDARLTQEAPVSLPDTRPARRVKCL